MTKTKTSTSNRLSMQKLNKILDNQLFNVNNIKIIIRYTDGIKAWEFTEEQISNRKAFILELFKLCSFIKSEQQFKPILIQSISNYNPFTIKDYTIEDVLKTEKLLSKQFKNTSIKIVA